MGIVLGETGILLPDSPTYIGPAKALIEQGVFNNSEGLPEITRTPGYPLFLSVFFGLNAGVLGAIVAQNILAISCAFFTALIIRGTSKYSFITAYSLITLNFLFIVYSNLILSELLFSTLSMGSFFMLIQASRTTSNTWRPIIAASLLAGCATLVRPIGCFLFLPTLPFIFCCIPARKLQLSALFLITFLLFPGGWIVRNYCHTGNYSISTIGNYNLIAYQAAGTLAIAMAGDWNTNIETTRANLLREANKRISQQETVSSETIDAIYKDIALETIRTHPIDYAKTIVLNTITTLLGNATTFISHITGTSPQLARKFTLLYTIPATLLALIGLIAGWKQQKEIVILSILYIGYYVGIPALTGTGGSRFRMPVEAIFSLNIAIAIDFFYTKHMKPTSRSI